MTKKEVGEKSLFDGRTTTTTKSARGFFVLCNIEGNKIINKLIALFYLI